MSSYIHSEGIGDFLNNRPVDGESNGIVEHQILNEQEIDEIATITKEVLACHDIGPSSPYITHHIVGQMAIRVATKAVTRMKQRMTGEQ